MLLCLQGGFTAATTALSPLSRGGTPHSRGPTPEVSCASAPSGQVLLMQGPNTTTLSSGVPVGSVYLPAQSVQVSGVSPMLLAA